MAKKTKKPAKATAKKKTSAHAPKKAAAAAKVVVPLSKIQPSTAPRTKSEIMSCLADTTGLSKKDVGQVLPR